jgi:outer membrane immunogenic protein
MKMAALLPALSLLVASPAMSADMRLPAKAPVAAPVYNWTGCYLGAGGGYGMFDQEVTFVDSGRPIGLSTDVGGRGWFGTVQVGCDYQISGNIVIGAFADYDFSGIKGNWHTAVSFSDLVGEEKLKSSWAVGGRIGWIAFQPLLVYVSAGFTEARFNSINLAEAFPVVPTQFSVDRHTYSGWFIGTGYEYALGFFPGLFWKTEYRFADYGTDRVPLLGGGRDTGDSFDQRKFVQTVRSELVWRFNWGGRY